LLSLVGAAGAVALGISVAADSDALAIIGGVGTAAGIVLGALAAHMTIDYDMYRRLEDLEKK
jgi:pyruvate/2-oxoacid:ferredoxin oxidoreductase beta subunit